MPIFLPSFLLSCMIPSSILYQHSRNTLLVCLPNVSFITVIKAKMHVKKKIKQRRQEMMTYICDSISWLLLWCALCSAFHLRFPGEGNDTGTATTASSEGLHCLPAGPAPTGLLLASHVWRCVCGSAPLRAALPCPVHRTGPPCGGRGPLWSLLLAPPGRRPALTSASQSRCLTGVPA